MKREVEASSEFRAEVLLESSIATIRDVHCRGSCKGLSAEECAARTELVFPYRGAFVRHVGRDKAVAEANQVLFFNAGDAYRVSHPVAGGDASLSIAIGESELRELAGRGLLHGRAQVAFRKQRMRVDARVQSLAALLRHRMRRNFAGTLEAESVVLALVRRAVGLRTQLDASGGMGRQRFADRAKLALTSDLSRRWTLRDVASEVGCSPVYLTQIFQQVEGLPLYRYHLRLRLARALDLLAEYEDLTELSLELGFSSHSHFSAAFRAVYGSTPSDFRRSASRR
ncbi:MAG TPA: AraC family transcriptional regulator [Bryobacteraceae bacterium]|nr:AraC family transcriptional regulator [Bryobacteraceae bacterium]